MRNTPSILTLVARTSAAALAMLAAGCVNELSAHPYAHAHDHQELTATPAAMSESWTLDGDWLVSPRLEAPDGATRVGALVGRSDASQPPLLEARVIGAAGPGPWRALAPTFADEDQLVATVDFEEVGAAAELRVRVADLGAFANLRFAAVMPDLFDPSSEPTTEDEVDEARSAIRTELQGLGIVTREQWGARTTRCTTADASKRRFAIHHTVSSSSDPARQVRGIQAYHMDTRGWCDVGYHFLIGSDGRVYEGRPLSLVGAHVGGENTGNVGISFVGCFHTSGCSGLGITHPTDAMVRAAGRLMGSLRRLYGVALSASVVKGHGEHPGQSTTCPGANLRPRIAEMITIGNRETLAGSSTPGATPAPTPPPSTAACTHSFGGRYGEGACSASYQCCGSAWRTRGTCGACACVETSGELGCSATPTPTPPPPATPGASCTHSFGGTYGDGACSSGYQCCDGSWSVRGACGACACVETSGERGCGGDAPAPSDPVYRGLSLAGSEIPRSGIANRTLESTLGVAVEPLGTVVTFEGQRYVRGRVSWFGSPRDTSGVTATETGAITGELLRGLNDPLDPSAATLRARPEDYYYVAMRFAYSPNGRSFWRDARLLVVSPRTGAKVVVRPVDWGPHTRTGRVLDLSPQSLRDLGLTTDDEALVAFAAPGTPLGPVR